jgi:hypothetical protein
MTLKVKSDSTKSDTRDLLSVFVKHLLKKLTPSLNSSKEKLQTHAHQSMRAKHCAWPLLAKNQFLAVLQ